MSDAKKPETMAQMITRVTIERHVKHGHADRIPAHVLRSALRHGIPIPKEARIPAQD